MIDPSDNPDFYDPESNLRDYDKEDEEYYRRVDEGLSSWKDD